MKTTTKIALAIVIACSVAGSIAVGTWRYRISQDAVNAAQAVIVRDRSNSQLGGCDRVAGMSQELISEFPFSENSKLALMVTGDDASAGEPLLVVALDVPTTKRVTEGKAIVIERRQALVEKLREACRVVGQTTQSPIYMGVRRAVEYVRAHGCNGRNRCIVYVQSDLEELSEKSIRDSIRAVPAARPRNSAPLPTAINNSGIDVKICGLAETVGSVGGNDRRKTLSPKHDAMRADEIVNVWRKLFTDADRVVFNSHCPNVSNE